MIGYIYKITNKVNNKVYIGKTIQDVKRRFKQHISLALLDRPRLRHLSLYAAIRKYGASNFTFTTLESLEVHSPRDLNSREVYWISYYDTTNNEKGYNLTGGGDGGTNMLPETISKIIETKRVRGHLKLSEATKKKISKAHKGKKFSDEHKKHLSENHYLKTTHVLLYKDGHTETSTESIQKLADKLGVTAICLRRASEVGDFRCGEFFLLDLTDLSAAFNHKYRYSSEKCFLDPVVGDIVSHNTIRARNQHHPLDYKGLVLYNYTKNKQKEKEEYISYYTNLLNKALESKN